MFKNDLKLLFRNILKNRLFASINIFGLSLGLSISTLIFLWIQDELSFDGFHDNHKDLYVAYIKANQQDGQVAAFYNSPAKLPEELKKQFPEIQYASGYAKFLRLSQKKANEESFRYGEKVLKMSGSRAGEDFFTMFSYPLIYGTPESALSEPRGIAISRDMAEIFFGNVKNAMGKSLLFENMYEVNVTAIFENVPSNSTDQFDYLLNWDNWVSENRFKQLWDHFGTNTYVQLSSGTNVELLEKKLQGFINKYMDAPNQLDVGLQKYDERHIYSTFRNGVPSDGNIEYIRLFGGISVFILIIACINYMNLATALSLKRSKEIGVKKVLGSTKSKLVSQFFSEAVIICLIALVVSILISFALLPTLNDLTQKELTLPLLNPIFWIGLCAVVFLCAILAGGYPAFYLSSFDSIKILKGAFKSGKTSMNLRRGLTLIISTIVILRQINYLQTKNLGYDKEHIIYVPIEGELVSKYSEFKSELLTRRGIKTVDRSSQIPHQMDFVTDFVTWQGKDEDEVTFFTPSSVGFDFVEVMNLKVKEGRDFSKSMGTDDSLAFLVNEKAVEAMKVSDPVGLSVQVFGKSGKIVGVLEDYHFNSLHKVINPLILDIKEGLPFGTVVIKTEKGKTRQALIGINNVYNSFNPNNPITITFADAEYDRLYKNEAIVGELITSFSFLAIIISCLGLLGLAEFSASQLRKQTGIRKVLGATSGQISFMFLKDFLLLVLVASVISFPIAYFGLNNWLGGFAYRTDMSWWIFAIAGFVTLFISLISISYQVLKVGNTDPAQYLRIE